MNNTSKDRRTSAGSRRGRSKTAVWIGLAVVALAAAAFAALGGLDRIPVLGGSGEGAGESGYADVESAVLEALRPTYGEDLLGVEISVDASATVSVAVRTSLAADTEVVTRAVQIAAEAASLEVLRREWPTGTIVADVWPSESETYMARAVAKVRGGALAGPVRATIEESFRPGMGAK